MVRTQSGHLGWDATLNYLILTLEGIENKRRLQTLSIENAWSNKTFLYYLTFRSLLKMYVVAYETSSNTENFY